MIPLRKFRIPILVMAVLSLLMYQCTNDDDMPDYVPGDAVIDTEGTVWRFDKAHSNVEWETAYLGELALLTGRFSDFFIDVDFDEQNPELSSIFASVVITSNLTGEPNRDHLGGCMPTTLGVIHNGDTLADGSLDPAGIDSLSNVASFQSVSITRDGPDYHAKGMLTFKGVSDEVELVFNFLGVHDHSDAQDASDLRAAFTGEFSFLAKSIFGVDSDNIGDEVTVKINCHTRLR
ncbi:YceI family protein [Marinoscillum sp. MHG1-6]|uniref:YceI family protein n=1 Tax=Marinoscillum sp. MHG1-6 TaxID=2959627 RepID=UPI002157B1E9|nr:YceI family protein [Marinoscillum sp. MHG1-6]